MLEPLFTRWLPKVFQKQDLLCVSVTTSFGVNNFRNTEAMRFIFFLQNVFRFVDNCIWIGNGKLSVLWPEYSSSAVNVLKNSPKISDLIKNDFFKLYLAQNDKNVWQKCLSADLSSFRGSLTRWLSKFFQKQDPLCVSLTTSFEVNNFRNNWPMRFTFFIKMFKI